MTLRGAYISTVVAAACSVLMARWWIDRRVVTFELTYDKYKELG
jgi:hypothetical protein